MYFNDFEKEMIERIEAAWDKYYAIYNDDCCANHGEEPLIAFFKVFEDFPTFGEGLLRLMQEKDPSVNTKHPVPYIVKACGENGVKVGEDVLTDRGMRNWYSKKLRPDKGPKERSEKSRNDRDQVFALAFGLQFNEEETRRLFNEVYLDIAFDMRSEEECIYWHCISKEKQWIEAKRLIAELKRLKNNRSHEVNEKNKTKYTKEIAEDIYGLDEKELLEYIVENDYNFKKRSVSANKKREKYIKEAAAIVMREKKERVSEEKKEQKDKNDLSPCAEVGPQELFLAITEDYYCEEAHELEEIFDNYLRLFYLFEGNEKVLDEAFEPLDSDSSGNKSLSFCCEIVENFPDKDSLSLEKTDLGYEKLRKTIILLFSYVYWKKQEKSKPKQISDAYKTYKAAVNDVLKDCGFSFLYAGNPYDALFLFCNKSEDPLQTFQDVYEDCINRLVDDNKNDKKR